MTSEDSRSRVPDPPRERGRCTLSWARVPGIPHEGKPQDGTARPPASHPRSSSIGEEQSWQKSGPHAWCPQDLCSQRGTERAAGIERPGRRGPSPLTWLLPLLRAETWALSTFLTHEHFPERSNSHYERPRCISWFPCHSLTFP